jgi:hypothetical protein
LRKLPYRTTSDDAWNYWILSGIGQGGAIGFVELVSKIREWGAGVNPQWHTVQEDIGGYRVLTLGSTGDMFRVSTECTVYATWWNVQLTPPQQLPEAPPGQWKSITIVIEYQP